MFLLALTLGVILPVFAPVIVAIVANETQNAFDRTFVVR
jgi:hypothetical protein